MTEITTLREQIAALKSEQATIIAQPVSRDAVAQSVRDGVQDAAPQSEQQSLATLQRLATGQPAPLLTVKAMTPHGPATIDLLPVMIRMLGTAAVTKALLRGLDDVPDGLAPEALAKRLATIVAELRALEVGEETLIRESGGVIARRPGADPAAVLAL